MKKNNTVYLNHMNDAIDNIDEYTKGVSFQTYSDNRMMQDAIVRQLEIIGEACKSISEEFRQKHPNIPWGQIIGMRNRIVHDYVNVDIEIIWDIVI